MQRFVCMLVIFSLVFRWPVGPDRFCCCQGASAAALEGGGSIIGLFFHPPSCLCVGTSSLWVMGFECWSASFQISNRGRGFFSNSAAHCQRLRCRSCLRAINTLSAALAGCVYFDSGFLRCACLSADVAAMQHPNVPFHTSFLSAVCVCVREELYLCTCPFISLFRSTSASTAVVTNLLGVHRQY